MKMIIPRSERFDSVLYARIAQRESLADEARMEYVKMLVPDFSELWPALMGKPTEGITVTLLPDGVEIELPFEMFQAHIEKIRIERNA